METPSKPFPKSGSLNKIFQKKPTLPHKNQSSSQKISEFEAKLKTQKEKAEEKKKNLISQELSLSENESQLKKKQKEILKKERQIYVQKSGISRIVAEVVASGIINEIVWNVVFGGLKKDEVSLNSRKHACRTALNKMKNSVGRLECMKRTMEEKALELINQKYKAKNIQKKKDFSVEKRMSLQKSKERLLKAKSQITRMSLPSKSKSSQTVVRLKKSSADIRDLSINSDII